MTQEIKKRGRGRPPKSEVAAVKPGNKGKVGRPKGDAAIINDYKARMLASPKSRKVMDANKYIIFSTLRFAYGKSIVNSHTKSKS